MEVYGYMFGDLVESRNINRQEEALQQVPALFAIAVSEELQSKEQAFFAAIDENKDVDHGLLYAQLYEGIIDHAIDFFIMQPSEIIELSKTQLKLVNVIISSIKSIRKMCNKVLLKRDKEELKLLSDFWRTSFRRSDQSCVYVIIPLEETLSKDFAFMVESCRTGKTQENMDYIVK